MQWHVWTTTKNFNPRSPHGERRESKGDCKEHENISTHAPRTGSDGMDDPIGIWGKDFNPRSPHGERLLTAEGYRCLVANFNPRSPHGERRDWIPVRRIDKRFQPTLPARGATRIAELEADTQK